MTTQLAGMATEIEGLYASAPHALPFAPAVDTRAFALRRDQGNLLLYSVAELGTEASAIEQLGGVSRQYLNHRHEAMLASDWLPVPLFVHERERDAVADAVPVRGTFSRRHTLDEDFEVIPTPGHTAGATAYLWDSGRHRFLFTGDTIYLDDGEWVARCSARAIATATSRAWSLCESSTSTCSFLGQLRAAGPTTRSPTGQTPAGASIRSSSACGTARATERDERVQRGRAVLPARPTPPRARGHGREGRHAARGTGWLELQRRARLHRRGRPRPRADQEVPRCGAFGPSSNRYRRPRQRRPLATPRRLGPRSCRGDRRGPGADPDSSRPDRVMGDRRQLASM